MKKALALVNVAPNHIELEELKVPDPGPDDVVVLTRHSMISNGTERSVLAGERKYGRDISPFPQVGGYQKVGIVESVGQNVSGISEGDWVFACMGRTNLPGYTLGGHISVSVTPKEQTIKLPEGLSPLAASGLVLTQVGFNHGSRPPVSEGTRAIVVGDGLVGLWSAETLQARGAAVLLAGRHEERLQKFKPTGRSRVINTRQTDLRDAVQQFSPSGASVVIDTLATTDDLHNSLDYLAYDGHLVAGGFYTEGHDLISYFPLTIREATLYTPGGFTRPRLERTLEWVAQGRLRVLDKITHRWPISRAIEAYDLLIQKSEPFLAMVIDW